MQNLFPYFLDQVNRGLRQAYLSFDSFAGAMSSVHFTLIAIVIIGLGGSVAEVARI